MTTSPRKQGTLFWPNRDEDCVTFLLLDDKGLGEVGDGPGAGEGGRDLITT